jgi:hypothetical protein
MSDYGPPPPPPYPGEPVQPPYGGPPVPPPPAAPTLADRLGARLLRRPEPRFGVALAGVGVVLVIFGVLVWAGEYASSGGGGGGPFGEGRGGGSDSHKILGIALSLVVIAIGYAVAIVRERGPLTNAGVAASALGIPVLMGFLSYDTSNTSGLPISTDAIAVVSMVVWLASYVVLPAVRGHVFYLGTTLLTLWLYLLDKIEPHLFSAQWIFPFAFANDSSFDSSGNFDVPSFSPPDFNTVAAVCLVFGLGYYIIALVLDTGGRSGIAVAFALIGFLATASGIAAAAVNLAQAATGVLLIVLGTAIGAYGARSRRRFTTWLSCGAIGFGIILILAKAIPDNATEAGISLIIVGALLVGVAATVSQLANEPDETAVSPAARRVQPAP